MVDQSLSLQKLGAVHGSHELRSTTMFYGPLAFPRIIFVGDAVRSPPTIGDISKKSLRPPPHLQCSAPATLNLSSFPLSSSTIQSPKTASHHSNKPPSFFSSPSIIKTARSHYPVIFLEPWSLLNPLNPN